MFYGSLPLSSPVPQLNSGEEKALKLLYEYLSEVGSQSRVSAAITNGLEAVFDGSHSRHSDGPLAARATFASLGNLLHPRNFGCGSKLFKQMEGFFLKHSEEIFAAHDGLFYISVLDGLSLIGKCDMAPTLACLVRNLEITGVLTRDSRRLESLSRKSHIILESLIAQSDSKAHRQHRSAMESHHLRRKRPRFPHRPHSHQGFFPPSPRSDPGNVLYLQDVRDLCLRTLEMFDRQPAPPGLDFPYGPYGYEEDFMVDAPYMYGGGGSPPDAYHSQLMLEPELYPEFDGYSGFPSHEPHWRPRRGRRSQRQLGLIDH